MPSENRPVVSIIICTHNRADDLRSTLQALQLVHVPAELPTELIIVDNNSSDDTAQVAQSTPLPHVEVRYLLEKRQGKSYALNSALAIARGDIMLFTDDDVRLSPHWIEKMCAPILSGQADGVAGGVLLAPHLKRDWVGLLLKGWFASTEGDQTVVPKMLLGLNMALSRRVFEKVPAFDVELGPGALGFGDDALFSFQVIDAEYNLLTAFDATVEHHFDASRLQRVYLLRRAATEGRTTAYLWHHWLHLDVSHPKLRAIVRGLQLAALRLARWRECRVAEGSPEWELQLLKKIHCYKQFAIEARRPRNYDKRGLVKLHGPGSRETS